MMRQTTKGKFMSDWNANVIEEFRGNEGAVGGVFEGRPMLILHTTGAKSGQERLAPLVYRSEGERVFVFASKGGADTHPDWYHNIKANPDVTVEIGSDTRPMTASVVEQDERDDIFARQAAEWRNFAEYQAGTDRIIPVVELS